LKISKNISRQIKKKKGEHLNHFPKKLNDHVHVIQTRKKPGHHFWLLK